MSLRERPKMAKDHRCSPPFVGGFPWEKPRYRPGSLFECDVCGHWFQVKFVQAFAASGWSWVRIAGWRARLRLRRWPEAADSESDEGAK